MGGGGREGGSEGAAHIGHHTPPVPPRAKRPSCGYNPPSLPQVVSDINNRLDAVEDLMHSPDLRGIIEGLKSLPDLERLVSRVFAGGRDVQQVCGVWLGRSCPGAP